jgi:hypothetical protein
MAPISQILEIPARELLAPSIPLGHALPLNAVECAEVLVAELKELAGTDPVGFRYHDIGSIESRIAQAALRATSSQSREVVTEAVIPTQVLFSPDTCQVLVRGMVEIMDQAIKILSGIRIEPKANSEKPLHTSIHEQFEVLTNAAFIVKRVMTQTPDSFNNPSLRNFLHAAALRLATDSVEAAGKTEMPSIVAASRAMLPGSKETESDAEAAIRNFLVLNSRSSSSLNFVEAIKGLIKMQVAISSLCLFNGPLHHVIMDLESRNERGRIHNPLEPEALDQFGSLFMQINIRLHEGMLRQNKFMGQDHGLHPLALPYAHLYDEVCYLVPTIVECMKDELAVLERYRKATHDEAHDLRLSSHGVKTQRHAISLSALEPKN